MIAYTHPLYQYFVLVDLFVYLISSIISDIKILSIFNPIISNIFKNSNNVTEIFNGFTSGIIECTTGCNILSKYASVFSVSLAASLISLGGISIIFQSLIYLSKAQVNIKIFLLSKILQSIISFVLCYSSLIIVNIF